MIPIYCTTLLAGVLTIQPGVSNDMPQPRHGECSGPVFATAAAEWVDVPDSDGLQVKVTPLTYDSGQYDQVSFRRMCDGQVAASVIWLGFRQYHEKMMTFKEQVYVKPCGVPVS